MRRIKQAETRRAILEAKLRSLHFNLRMTGNHRKVTVSAAEDGHLDRGQKRGRVATEGLLQSSRLHRTNE